MIDCTHKLPAVRQVQLLDLSRSSVYYLPQPTPGSNLRLMRRMDELHLELHSYDTVSVARQALNRYFDFYNCRRPHSTLDGKTLDTGYFNFSKPPLAAAA